MKSRSNAVTFLQRCCKAFYRQSGAPDLAPGRSRYVSAWASYAWMPSPWEGLDCQASRAYLILTMPPPSRIHQSVVALTSDLLESILRPVARIHGLPPICSDPSHLFRGTFNRQPDISLVMDWEGETIAMLLGEILFSQRLSSVMSKVSRNCVIMKLAGANWTAAGPSPPGEQAPQAGGLPCPGGRAAVITRCSR